MKKVFLLLGFCLFFVQFAFSQITVASDGSVGIGIGPYSYPTSSNVTLEGNSILLRSRDIPNFGMQLLTQYDYTDFCPSVQNSGHYFFLGSNSPFDYIGANNCSISYIDCITLTQYSDKQLKKNIIPIPYNREAFQKLNPVSFDISDSLLLSANGKKTSKKSTNITEYGFIAQEVQDIYPQLVSQDKKTGYLKLKPLEIIPILVSALHDQQAQIDALKELVANTNSSPKKIGASSSSETDALTYPVLDQNIPNPFNMATTIGFYLPTTIGTASVYVYDMNGVQLKSFSVTQRGKGSITVQGSEFIAGMYLYALIADGKVIDTKRMILTK